jgi:hypothetical protein
VVGGRLIETRALVHHQANNQFHPHQAQ